MTQETPASQPRPADETGVPSPVSDSSDQANNAVVERETAPAPSTGGKTSTSGLPAWAPLALLAVVPALIVGALVYLLAGSGSSSSAAAVEGFVKLSSTDQNSNSFKGGTPAGFPRDFPTYDGAEITASFLIEAEQGVSYFVVYETDDSTSDVYDFYQERLDSDPWQVDLGSKSRDVQTVSFSNPEDPDVTGSMTIYPSDLEGKTVIYLSIDDVTPAANVRVEAEEFELPASLAKPEGWPTDVPIYDEDDSIIIDSAYQRGAGVVQYYVTLLTKEDPSTVLSFYDSEFKKRGWTVTETTDTSTSFALSIEVNDAAGLEGQLQADTFAEDNDYTQVDILIQVDSSRTPSRGN